MTPARQSRANALFHLVTTTTGPWTKHDLANALGVSVPTIKTAIHDLREICGLLHNVTLPCEPNGWRQPWLYYLTGQPSESEWWVVNRMLDLYTRAGTMNAVVEATLRGMDRRTIEAREARVFQAALETVQRTLAALY